MTQLPPQKDWRDHLQAMNRWRQRALKTVHGRQVFACDGWEMDGSEASDFARAFFIWAHSMRDWFISSDVVSKDKLDELLNQRQEWKMVRDLANKTKHKNITKNPVDPNWISGMKIDANKLLQGGNGIEMYILHNGNYMPYEDTINDVWAMWRIIIAELGLDYDEVVTTAEAPNAPSD